VGRAAAASEAKLILGRYRPVRPLGSGGSGSVWLAHDERSGRKVALKIVPREGNAASRAEREAATAARLRHERCLRAYTLARDAEHVYIAYEFVPGRTLRDALRTETLSDRDVLRIAAQILEGLAHAHEQGIVHRDVKPSNVLLADGPDISVRLLDFGLALIREEDTLTAAGDVPGTLAYISPERLRGRTATPAADVWAVGVLVWEALAGRHPFWRSSVLETARAIQGDAPSLAKARPDLPRRLTAVVDRALSTDPRKRPSAARLAATLRRAPGRRRRRHTLPARPSNTVLLGGVAAGLYALFGATALPFYPSGAPIVLALAAALLAAIRPRLGLALALAVPVLPLGNVAQGLAIVYAAAAAAWFACSWRRPREALVFVEGPLLAAVGGLGLLPLALARCPGRLRRAALGALAVLSAGVVSGLDGRAVPFTGDARPGTLRIEGADRPAPVVRALHRTLSAEPGLIRLTLVLAAAAAVLPLLRQRGPWVYAGFGAAVLGCSLLPATRIEALPLALTVWATCSALALRELAGGVAWRSLAARARVPVRAAEPSG
jgi:hypothetical protein